MVQIKLADKRDDLDSIYKPLCDMGLYEESYKSGVEFTNGESYLSIYLFMKSVGVLLDLSLADDIVIRECNMVRKMELVSFISENDYIVETYHCFIKTLSNNYSFRLIPPHSLSSRIPNDNEFISQAYDLMELDPDFQFMGVKYGDVEEYPIKNVQLIVLLALHYDMPNIDRDDFLFICKEFYSMTRHLNEFVNFRVKEISFLNNLDMDEYNPSLLFMDCDNVDRSVFNKTTEAKFIMGYSLTDNKSHFINEIPNMKLI